MTRRPCLPSSWILLVSAWALLMGSDPCFGRDEIVLKDNWHLQSSVAVKEDGHALSSLRFSPEGWYPTSVPRTLLAALVDNKVYPDPFYGENLKSLPGYVEGSWLAMPLDSPFYPSWWYCTRFQVSQEWRDKTLTLHLDGINYQANVWLNGKRIADAEEIKGMFRRFSLDVTDEVHFKKDNVLAIEIIGPGKLLQKKYHTKQLEATTGWDDHNPQPPDLNAGIWQDVSLVASGPVSVADPCVRTRLDLPSTEVAHLTVSALLTNLSSRKVTATLEGEIEEISFSTEISLDPSERRVVDLKPEDFPGLNIQKPRLWWPNGVGSQELYPLDLTVKVNGEVSDDEKIRFGIREVTTEINEEGWRFYKVNGKRILIRGGAWMTTDMLLRLSEDRYDALIRYAKESNLNMLRSEGFSIRETEEFYNLCDQYGIMVTQQIFGRNIPDEALAIQCIEDMMLRVRKHPSLVHFLGHDETFPTKTLDAAYKDLIARLTPDRTYQPHSGAFEVEGRFQTGGTRTGTRELWTYATPVHYYMKKEDGAWGFAQSGGIGGIVACLESVKRMMPEDQLWPLWTNAWSFHTVIQGGEYFDALIKAMDKRYGKPEGIEDFCMTGQVMNYESSRGMFEAYGRNKYSATGITTWKYDAAWPAAMTWQYVDWYLLPTGAYFGAQKACEPLHVQYSYDDQSVVVVNGLYQEFKDLTVVADGYNMDMTRTYTRRTRLSVGPDDHKQAFVIEWYGDLSKSYFLSLKLLDASGALVDDNFYWLSTVPDVPGSERELGDVFSLQPESVADHSELRKLPKVQLEASGKLEKDGESFMVRATIKNPSGSLAFFVRPAVLQEAGGSEIAPSFWKENCVSLMPGEEKTMTASFYARNLSGASPVLRVEGWNVQKTEVALSR